MFWLICNNNKNCLLKTPSPLLLYQATLPWLVRLRLGGEIQASSICIKVTPLKAMAQSDINHDDE